MPPAKFAKEFPAPFGRSVVGDAINSACGIEASWNPVVTGNEIDRDIVRPGLTQVRQQRFNQRSRSALDQENSRDRNRTPAEKVPHSIPTRRRVRGHNFHEGLDTVNLAAINLECLENVQRVAGAI